MRKYYKIALFVLMISFAAGLISACAVHKAQIIHPEIVKKSKNVFLYGHEDVADINPTIKTNLIKLGFNVVENIDEAELLVDYNFRCNWDLFHYTCENFNMFVSDASTRDIVFRTNFLASSPYSASTLINEMFKNLEKELSKNLAQPKNPPDKKGLEAD